MLQAIHIRKQFQRSGEVLRDVSFTLGDGEFLSVIGPSGAGKTTLFRILNGTELCSGGEVLYGGTHFEAARGREKRALQQGIGTIYQDFCLVENLSACWGRADGSGPNRPPRSCERSGWRTSWRSR